MIERTFATMRPMQFRASPSRATLNPIGTALLLLLLLIGLTTDSFAKQHGGPAAVPTITERMDQRFRLKMNEERIPGSAWAIVHDGQIVRIGVHGFVDSRRSRAVDDHTVFRIASVSKGFAGVLSALLADEGQFRLEDPIRQYAPSFRFKSGNSNVELTIEDVLGQRSGFVPNAYDNMIESGRTRQQIYPHFAELAPICPPRTCYSYQNSVFSLIEDVIETATSVPYPDLLEQRIFEPLTMQQASVGYEAFMQAENRAEPHLKTRFGWRQTEPRSTYYQVSSAAGINASIADMGNWAIAMLGHRPEVLSADVIQASLQPMIQTRRELRNRNWRDMLSDAHYALGWRLYQIGDESLALHSGWVAGFRAEITLSHAHDLGLVILMNAESRAVGELSSAFWQDALNTLASDEAVQISAN